MIEIIKYILFILVGSVITVIILGFFAATSIVCEREGTCNEKVWLDPIDAQDYCIKKGGVVTFNGWGGTGCSFPYK